MIVVTGGTGHVGNALLRCLVAGGAADVRVLVRDGSSVASLADLEVEVFRADLRDYSSLVEAFRGAHVVYHIGGIISIGARGLKRLRRTNVEGTRNVIEACRAAQVGRLVYTSSVHALVEPPPGTYLSETADADPTRVRGPYAKTKAEATRLVLDAAREHLDAVVVYPSAVIGPFDFRPSDIGRLVIDCCRGGLRVYVRGQYDFVDVRDVACGLLAAASKGRRGEGYILSGHQVSITELIETADLVNGTSFRRWRSPLGLARAASFLMPGYYWVRRQPPRFTPYSLAVISSNSLTSHEKAERDLGYVARPFDETMRDTVEWFRRRGML